MSPYARSHPSRVRELKRSRPPQAAKRCRSHPSRVRELKPFGEVFAVAIRQSHPSRVRELKLGEVDAIVYVHASRTPPGCVN